MRALSRRCGLRWRRAGVGSSRPLVCCRASAPVDPQGPPGRMPRSAWRATPWCNTPTQGLERAARSPRAFPGQPGAARTLPPRARVQRLDARRRGWRGHAAGGGDRLRGLPGGACPARRVRGEVGERIVRGDPHGPALPRSGTPPSGRGFVRWRWPPGSVRPLRVRPRWTCAVDEAGLPVMPRGEHNPCCRGRRFHGGPRGGRGWTPGKSLRRIVRGPRLRR